jgi:predicted  nucleic acid-binding Zn-ribbon protein
MSRIQVHTCPHCAAVFEGGNPPSICPGCHTPSKWRTVEVDKQPGVVGGRAFVPGTQTPMTRVFYCAACSKMVVTRDGSVPKKCAKCAWEAFNEASPNARILPETPAVQKSPADALMEQALAAKKAEQEELAAEEYATLNAILKWMNPKMPEGEYVAKQAPEVTAEEYRREWIVERAIELWVAPDAGLDAEASWLSAEKFYDVGKAKGFLP